MTVSEFGSDPAVSSESAAFSREDARRQLQKILASNLFSNSGRMKAFLSLIVEYALAGRAHELKEYLIGVEVFDRGASFDPRLDPIVRVEARRLRAKLDLFYQTVGRRDELRIDFPKGSYVPRFYPLADSGQPETESNAIAVLPFRNLGPDPDHEYFSDGLSEELIHLLTRVPGLQIMAWHSSAQLKRVQGDLAGIRELGVQTVLCGSVRRSGGQLRVAAQLIDTGTGKYMWSGVYDREPRDLLAIEEDIARSIVNTLRVNLSRPVPSRGAMKDSANVEAHNCYLLGRFHFNRRTPEGLLRSIDFYEKAISIDAANALAHAGLADTYSLLVDYAVRSPGEAVPLARAAAQRALTLDPLLAEAYTALAFIRSNHDWCWYEGEDLYRQAEDLNPGYAQLHHWFGIDHLALRGRFDEAWDEIELAQKLDPLSAIISEGRGYLLLLGRRYDEALSHYRELVDLHPFFYKAFTAIGRTLTQLGRYTEAIDMFQKGRSLSGEVPNILAALGQTYALDGREKEARQTLSKLKALAAERYVPASSLAVVHIGLGETEAALDLLEIAAERRELTLACLNVHPLYDSLRGEERFEVLVRRIFPELRSSSYGKNIP
jgi:serine/threonine-protein kinase